MASYGKACLRCTKAKVRCGYNNDQGPCERCIRLRKECQPAPRTRVPKRETRVDKHSALEAKVDGLVELLKQNQAISRTGLSVEGNIAAPPPQHRSCGPTIVASQLYSLPGQESNELQQINNTSAASQAAQASFCGSASSCSPASFASLAELRSETEEELCEVLDTYRDTMFPFFPVVIIGPEVTTQYMAAEHPMVWMILRAICTKRLALQFALIAEFKRLIGKTLIVEGERNFDMLCALIICANWGQFFCMKANLTPVINLAIGLAGDLGLTKSAPQTSPAVMLNWTPRGCPKPPHALTIKQRTMNERRVILGLFMVSSICANYFQRSEPMRWTPYLEECLKLLMQTAEHPTDELLSCLVRLQIIANGVQAEDWDNVYPHSELSQKLPRSQYIHHHKMQLDDLKRTIPAHLMINDILRLHLLGLEISIHEQWLLSSPIASNFGQTQCMEGLWACFTAVKSFFEFMFFLDTFPLATYLFLSIGIYSQLGHCFVALFRLSTFESPHIPWDRQRIVTELDLGDVARKLVYVYDAMPTAAGIDNTGVEACQAQWDYGKMVMLTTVLKWWDSKVRPSIMGSSSPSTEHGATQQETTSGMFNPSVVDFADMDFGLEDEEWLKEIMNSGFDFRTY